MDRIVARDNELILEYPDLPSSTRDQDCVPFFKSLAHPGNQTPVWQMRMFMPWTASKPASLAALATGAVALSRLKHNATYDVDAFVDYLHTMGGMHQPAMRLFVETLRHKAGIERFEHGIKFTKALMITVPKPRATERYHYLVMKPFGELLMAMTAGALNRTALVVGPPCALTDERSDAAKFFSFSVYDIMCEDMNDALTLAYAFEAEEYEYELF